MNFRKLLLNRCQKEFEKDKDDDEIFEQKQKEMDAAPEVMVISFRLLHSIYTHTHTHTHSQSSIMKAVPFLSSGGGAPASE